VSSVLDILDMSGDLVAAMTGIKQQFVAAGWDPRNAELMVIEMYRMAVAQQGKSD